MIYKFADKYYFLSNFFVDEIKYKGKSYQSLEHAYQSQKTTSDSEHDWIKNAPTPEKAKYFGKKIKIRKDWDDVKLDIMLNLIRIKFEKPELKKLLLETGNEELVEGNYWHDNTWGNCTCVNCKTIEGKNHLGKILMKVRQEIRDEIELFK